MFFENIKQKIENGFLVVKCIFLFFKFWRIENYSALWFCFFSHLLVLELKSQIVFGNLCSITDIFFGSALSLMVDLSHAQQFVIPWQSLLYPLCNKRKKCVNNFLPRCCGSYNNELYYEVGFNEVVGSLKMRLHFYLN